MYKKITRKNPGIITVTILLLIVTCQITLASEGAVSVLPQTISGSPGDHITVDILVDPAEIEIFGAGYELLFDSNILKATDQTAGTFLSQDGADTIEVQNKINNTNGIIEYGGTRTGEPDEIGGVTGSGKLATVTFEVIGSGSSDLKLDAMLVDPGARSVDAVISDGSDGTFIITPDKQISSTTDTAHQVGTGQTPPLPGIHSTETDSPAQAATQSPGEMHSQEDSGIQSSEDSEIQSEEDNATEESGFISPLTVIGLFVIHDLRVSGF